MRFTTRHMLAAAAVSLGAATAAPAATLDFMAEANGNERGVTDGTVLTLDGLDVTFTSSDFAYFDSGDAGLGVCKVLTASDQCNPSSDDNVTEGESVTIAFDAAQDLSGFAFRDANHHPLASTETLRFGVNGGALSQVTFADMGGLTFKNVLSATFAYDDGGGDANQFYVQGVTATAAVPLPATLPMIAAGLGALGLVGRRRRRAAA